MALVGASPRGNRSLFGLEVATLGQGPGCPSMQEQHSIDDEYAPAVFQVRLPAEKQTGGRLKGDSIRTSESFNNLLFSNTSFSSFKC